VEDPKPLIFKDCQRYPSPKRRNFAIFAQPSSQTPRGRTTEVFGFAAAFVLILKQVLAKAFPVFALIFGRYVFSACYSIRYFVCGNSISTS
jgi:hypothetical protein